jgi:hypothetical protein
VAVEQPIWSSVKQAAANSVNKGAIESLWNVLEGAADLGEVAAACGIHKPGPVEQLPGAVGAAAPSSSAKAGAHGPSAQPAVCVCLPGAGGAGAADHSTPKRQQAERLRSGAACTPASAPSPSEPPDCGTTSGGPAGRAHGRPPPELELAAGAVAGGGSGTGSSGAGAVCSSSVQAPCGGGPRRGRLVAGAQLGSSTAGEAAAQAGKPAVGAQRRPAYVLLVFDGTWKQAKEMFNVSDVTPWL